MSTRRTLMQTLILAALMVLSLPALAAAQGIGNDPWWRDRDNGRDRNDRRDRRYDRLRDSARRVENLSGRFVSDLDRALDRSRVNGTIREDRINDQARDFRNAADRFRNRLGDARNLNSSAGEARTLLQIGSRIDRLMSRFRLDARTENTWAQIRQELQVISNAYGFGRYDDYDRARGNTGSGNRWPY